MMTNSSRLIAGIVAIVLAILLIFVSCVDSIELIGKYEPVEVDGEEIDGFWENLGLDEAPGKFYMTYGFGGKVDMDFSLDSKFTKGLEDEELDYINEWIESIKEEVKDCKWSIDDGELVMEDPDGDEDEEKYSIKFNTLTLGKRSEATVLKRAGIMGYLCPSMIMRALALVLLLIGALLMIPKKVSAGAAYYESAICPSCGGAVGFGERFCQNCGADMGGDIPSVESPTGYCANCGSPIEADYMFCENCGAPVGADDVTVAPAFAPEPVFAPESVSSSTPVADTSSSTGGLKSTFKKSAEESVSVENSGTTTVETDRFHSAGDL